MVFFYDGQDPEYNAEVLATQNITMLLKIRDVCLVMRSTRLGNQSGYGGYEYNELQLEIWFLEKIIRILNKNLQGKLLVAGYSSLSKNLGLDDTRLNCYFDEANAWDNRYESIKSLKPLFHNFDRAISNDWKFL